MLDSSIKNNTNKESVSYLECGVPPTIANGVFNAGSGTSYLSDAHLVCDDNYAPGDGSLTSIVCDKNGRWTTPDTACITPGNNRFMTLYQYIYMYLQNMMPYVLTLVQP